MIHLTTFLYLCHSQHTRTHVVHQLINGLKHYLSVAVFLSLSTSISLARQFDVVIVKWNEGVNFRRYAIRF